jgi:integrase
MRRPLDRGGDRHGQLRFSSALRLGEIVTLTWSAVDLKRDVITIHQHKTRSPKSLPICVPLRAMLISLAPGVGNALVFRKPDGSAFYALEVQRAFALACKLSGVNAALSVHSIRHTVGLWLTIAVHPERHVAEVLGHSLRSVTRRYAHLAKGSLRLVIDDLVRIET